jgi:hypothetical protein
MNAKTALALIAGGLTLAAPLHAHRLEGLVQSSLVEVLPSHIGVQVTLVPGIDIAPKIKALLDPDGDGESSEIESDAWAELFMARQSVTVDGQSLPLVLRNVRISPLGEMNGGHAEIVVNFIAALGKFARGPRTIACANRYEPLPCTYQSNGLVPKAPGVRISSHRRDERQQELTLDVAFSGAAAQGRPTVASPQVIPRSTSAPALAWLIGLSTAGAVVAAIAGRRLRSSATDAPSARTTGGA